MAIENFLTTEFKIKSLEDISGTDKEQFGSESSIYYCHIQEFTGDLEPFFEGGVKKTYQMWFESEANLKQGMVVVIDSVEYEVASVANHDIIGTRNMSANKHKKAMIYKAI